MSKVKALANFLGVSEKEAQKLIKDEDYLVLTEEEADKKAEEEIRQSLWAFRAEFIIDFLNSQEEISDWQYRQTIKAIEKMQEELAEGANEIVYVLICNNYKDFVESAISADGRGHFISRYDGDENEQDGYFIYRQN